MLGSLIGAAVGNEDELRQEHYNKPLYDRLYSGKYLDALEGLRGSTGKAVTDYAREFDIATPEARRLQADDITNYSQMAKSGMAFNPLDYFDHILNAKVSGPSGIKSFLNEAEGVGNANLARKRLALGINGTGSSAFDTAVRANAFGQNFAPVLNTIYGGTAGDTNTLLNQRLSNIGNTLGLLRERAGVPDRLANRALQPAMIEQGLLGGEIDLARGVGAGSKENTSGYRLIQDKWNKFFDQMDEQENKTMDMVRDVASSAAKSYLSGGTSMLGGMGGGGGGGAPSSAAPAGYAAPSQFGNFQPTSMPGYGGPAAPSFGAPTYNPPPQYGVLGPGSLGSYSYNPTPASSYRPPEDYYSQFNGWDWN